MFSNNYYSVSELTQNEIKELKLDTQFMQGDHSIHSSCKEITVHARPWVDLKSHSLLLLLLESKRNRRELESTKM